MLVFYQGKLEVKMILLSSQQKSHRTFHRYLKSTKLKPCFPISLLVLFVTVSISVWLSTSAVAQESNTVSGRLIDTVGNPISDIDIYLRRDKEPSISADGSINITSTEDDSVQIKTDSKGRFAFSDVFYKKMELDVDCQSKIGYEIKVLSIEFGEITLYPFRAWHWSTVNFALEPGIRMENIVITADIRKRPKLTTRVVYADGSPVTNSQVYILRETKSLYRKGKTDGRGSITTDHDGYFDEYLSVDYPPRFYVTFAVEHQGLFAKATPFIMIDDVNIVLKLNGNPGSEMKPIIGYSERESALQALLKPPPMWVGNQTNGHAYKITKAQTIKDAMKQAEVEKAYLLSINDRAEEVWLSHIYGNKRIWIGLSDAEEEGKWKWHSGEPVDYTNWRPYQPDKGNTEDKDYVMTGYFDWEWEVYGEEFEKAILEKPLIHFTSQPD